MKITNNYKYSESNLYKSNKTTSPIHFKRNEELSNKQDSLNKDKAALLDGIKDTDGLRYSFYKVHKATQNALDIARIRNQYEELNELLNASSVIDYEKDQATLASFFNAMNALGDNKGFRKVFGYDRIKDSLMSNFVIKTMAKDKTSQGANVPNALLFFGPTGCGKTFFASALAEQTLSNVVNIDASKNFDYEQTFNEIKAAAEKAKEDYEQSKDEKKRTIIIINEFDYIANPDSPILDKLKEFMASCSDKYKCTLFLTTNYPFDIDESITDDKITTAKFGISYADKATANKIIKGFLKNAGKPLPSNTALLEKLFEGNNRYYSNQQICDILSQTIQRCINPKEQDYIDTINEQKIIGAISQKNIDDFNNEMFYFRTLDSDNPMYISQSIRQELKRLEDNISESTDNRQHRLKAKMTLRDYENGNNGLIDTIRTIRETPEAIETRAESIEKVVIGGIPLVDLWIDMQEGSGASKNYATSRLKSLWLKDLLKDSSKAEDLISKTLNMIEKSNVLVKQARASYKEIIEQEDDLTPEQKSILKKQQDSLLFFLVVSEGIEPDDIIMLQNNTIKTLSQLSAEEERVKHNANENIFEPCKDINVLGNNDIDTQQKITFIFALLAEKANSSNEYDTQRLIDKINSFKQANLNNDKDTLPILWQSIIKEAQEYFNTVITDKITDRNIVLLNSINENLTGDVDEAVIQLIKQQKTIEQKEFISRYKDDKNFRLLMNNPNIDISKDIDDFIYYEAILLNIFKETGRETDCDEIQKMVSAKFLEANQEYDINAQAKRITSLLKDINDSITSQSDIISSYAQASLSKQDTQIAQTNKMVQYLESISKNTQDIRAYNGAIVRAKLTELQRDDVFKEIVPDLMKLLPENEQTDIEEFMSKVDKLVQEEKDEATKKKILKAAAIIAAAIAAGAAVYYFGPEIVAHLLSGISTEEAIPLFSNTITQASFAEMIGNSGFMDNQIPFSGRTRTEEKERLKNAAESLRNKYADRSAAEFKRLLEKEENRQLKGSALDSFGKEHV